MSRFHAVARRAITILGLVAVFFAVLEHEDLILQDTLDSECCRQDGTRKARSLAMSDCDWSTPSVDRGTAGTFRSDPHKFWLLPARAVTQFLRRSNARSATLAWRRRGRRAHEPRSFATRSLVLRP